MWAQADTTLRIATFAAPLSRNGPGLLLRDINRSEDPQIDAIIGIINHIQPDILLLTDFDFDANVAALAAFSGQLLMPYDHLYSRLPNTGQQSGMDLDGDGFLGDPQDAWGCGRFLGDGGLAVLSRYPIRQGGVVDYSPTLWRDIPGAVLPRIGDDPFPSQEVQDVWPVSLTAHWIVPIKVGEAEISLLAFDATAPIFDGPEDTNGLRNRDELRLWEAVLDGVFGQPPQNPILIGNANADPFDGEGLRNGIVAVLARLDL